MPITNENFIFYLPTAATPLTLVSASSELTPTYAKENIQYFMNPTMPWQTTRTDITESIEFSGHASTRCLFIDRANMPQLVVQKKKLVGDTYERTGMPNTLFMSHEIRRAENGNGAAQAPWSQSGSGVTVNVDYTPGPDTRIYAQKLDFVAGTTRIDNDWTNEVSIANRSFVLSVWLKKISGSATVGVSLESGTYVPSVGQTDITTEWQRFTFSGTASAGANTNVKARIDVWAIVDSEILFGGAQLTFDTTTHIGSDYETKAVGLYLRKDDRVDRRKLLVRSNAGQHTGWDYVRFLIPVEDSSLYPSQEPDAEANWQIGSIVVVKTAYELSDKFSWPMAVQVEHEGSNVTYASGARDILRPGVPKVTISFGALNRMAVVGNELDTLVQQSNGQPIIIHDNTRVPGGHSLSRNMSRAYLTRLASPRRLRHTHPSLLEAAWTFEEVI